MILSTKFQGKKISLKFYHHYKERILTIYLKITNYKPLDYQNGF